MARIKLNDEYETYQEARETLVDPRDQFISIQTDGFKSSKNALIDLKYKFRDTQYDTKMRVTGQRKLTLAPLLNKAPSKDSPVRSLKNEKNDKQDSDAKSLLNHGKSRQQQAGTVTNYQRRQELPPLETDESKAQK